MNRIYLYLLSLVILSAAVSCNKPHDVTEFTRINFMGGYRVVYEALESVDVNGNLVITQACNTADMVIVSKDYVTWNVGDQACPSKEYNIDWPYTVGMNQLILGNVAYNVEYWDGYRLRMSSADSQDRGRYVIELER
jgi:hypothetical protein